MAIEWDTLLVEMTILGAIIYGAIFVEGWVEKRKARLEEGKVRAQIIQFVADDLNSKLRFIDETVRYSDFKPFFTDMWDSVILGGKQSVLPFALFKNLQHTYSWMKYYNNEVEQKNGAGDKAMLEILDEVKKSISQSLEMLRESR
jgi:hypothetical protein